MPTPQEAAAVLRDALASRFDPSALRLLREKRLREMERNMELQEESRAEEGRYLAQRNTQSAGERRRDEMMGWGRLPSFTSGATQSDVDALREDMDDDPDTGIDAQNRTARVRNALDQAATTNRQEVGDAANTTATRNAFAQFMNQRESNRGKLAAEVTQTGKDALDAASVRRQAENRARVRPGVSANIGGSYAKERADRSRRSVDELMGKVDKWTTGIGSLSKVIPGTPARNFNAELDTLKANIAFNELTEMRAASKTGGALGAVSNIELGLLQSTLGALDSGQSPENLKQQLQKVRDSLDRWESAKGGSASGVAQDEQADDDNDQPQVGERKRFPNGKVGIFDGSGWVQE